MKCRDSQYWRTTYFSLRPDFDDNRLNISNYRLLQTLVRKMSETIANNEKYHRSVGVEVENGSRRNVSIDSYSARKIEISPEQLEKIFNNDDFKLSELIYDRTLKLIRTDKMVTDILEHEKSQNMIESVSQRSFILQAEYEGGLEVWECIYYLGKYLLGEKIPFDNKFVLDLGCGTGMLGILALLKGANRVHFQDYNEEVIRTCTIPNVLLNVSEKKQAQEQCAFFYGDWASFAELSDEIYKNHGKKYDVILTSATIYNPQNYKKMCDVFEKKLAKNGTVYVAGKVCYAQYEGRMRDFVNFIKQKNVFDTKIVWTSQEGLLRQILKLTFKS